MTGWRSWTSLGAGQGLHHALRYQHEGEDQGQGNKDVEDPAREVGPEVPDGLLAAPCDAADQGHQHGHAGRGRQEVLHGQAEHLRQIAHRRFADVPLPVGVRDEAHRRVEGGPGLDRPEVRRVQGASLEALEEVDGEEAEEVEQEHGLGVGLPIHLLGRINAAHAVEQAFRGPQDPAQPRGLALVNARHVPAERLDHSQQ